MYLAPAYMENPTKTILEARILEAVNGQAGHYAALDGAARLLAVFGVLALAAAVILRAICSGDSRRRWGGWVTLIAVVPAGLAVWWVDQFLCRPRPFLCHPIRLLLCMPNGVSSPSIEMGASGALAFGLFAYGGRWRWIPLAYLVLLGAARVFCGIEYPLDQTWAAIAGCLAALATIFALNPRHILLTDEGWPVAATGTVIVLAAVFLSARTPEKVLPPPQSTCSAVMPVVSAEEKNMIRGMSPAIESNIANALLKLHLPGRIRRVGVGDGEVTSVAEVKFDAGPDSNPMQRPAMEREAIAIIRATLVTAPKVSEVDVFGVTTWDRDGTEVLKVAYSVAAQRKDAAFLFSSPTGKPAPAQALSRFGLVFCRVHRGRE